MIVMSHESLDEAEKLCRSNPNYRVCIYCESSGRALAIQEALLSAWTGARFDRYFGGGLAVRFPETNSVVRIMEPQDLRVTTLYSCHEVIADCGLQLREDVIQRLDSLVIDYELPLLEYTYSDGSIGRIRNVIVDEFTHDGWLNSSNNYTIYFENGSSITPIRNAPDFGEFSPSQELNNFVSALIQG